MSPSSHQTIRLARGRHRGPDHGACVMELASMLAGEPFSDHPACASPVVAAFLRTYNDLVDDERRQTLYPYAAMVVGTRAGVPVEEARGEMCANWIEHVVTDGARPRWRRWHLARAARRGVGPEAREAAVACARVASIIARQDGDVGHARVLAFLDQLIAGPRSDLNPVGAHEGNASVSELRPAPSVVR